MSVFERDKQREKARIGELRGLLKRVEEPEFWGRLNKSGASSLDKADSFQQAVLRRADSLSVSPQVLLASYEQGLRMSTYPTADCLEAEEAQAIVSGQPSANQAAHLEVCEPCRQLLAASRVDPDELRARLIYASTNAFNCVVQYKVVVERNN